MTKENIISNHNIKYSLSASNFIIEGTVENIPFRISGNLETKLYTGEALFYTGNDSKNNFDILFLGVEQNTETYIFFENIVTNSNRYSNVIKLYMQSKSTNEFIAIEIFIETDFVGNLITSKIIPYNAQKENSLRSWFSNYINIGDVEIVGTRKTNQVHYKRSGVLQGYAVIYHLIVDFVADITNIGLNAEKTGECKVYINDSYTTDSQGGYWSNTQVALMLKNVNVTFSAMPNLVITAQYPIRTGLDYTTFPVSYQTRTADCTASTSVIMDGYHGSMTNAPEYFEVIGTRGIKTTETGTLITTQYLMEKGDSYGFNIQYKDLVGVQSSGKCYAGFDFYLYMVGNSSQSLTDYKSFYINVNIG